jgi:hypothetical protein
MWRCAAVLQEQDRVATHQADGCFIWLSTSAASADQTSQQLFLQPSRPSAKMFAFARHAADLVLLLLLLLLQTMFEPVTQMAVGPIGGITPVILAAIKAINGDSSLPSCPG